MKISFSLLQSTTAINNSNFDINGPSGGMGLIFGVVLDFNEEN